MSKIKILFRNIAVAVQRYYGMLLVALVATVAFIAETQNKGYSDAARIKSELHIKLAILGLMGIALLFALHIARQRYKIRWPLPVLGFLILGGYFLLLPTEGMVEPPPVIVIILVVSAICFHLLVSVVPFLKRREVDGFWNYNKSVFINVVQTAVFTLVLWGGLMLAVLAVQHLFNIEVSDEFWGQLASVVLIMGSTLIFALFAKEGIEDLREATPYPVVLRFFVQYVLIPLLIIYLLILYSYSVKILVEWDLPKGWVSYLVLAYSFLGILSLLLLYPLNDVVDKVWVKFFSRAFYSTLLPLLALLFVAIGVRIADYGVTENRYYVVLLALWLLGVAIYQLIRRGNKIKVIPATLLVCGICSLLLPFVNVFSVSFNSQNNRLQDLLAGQHLLTEQGTINFEGKVQRTALREISDRFDYLNTRRQHRRIRAFIAAEKIAEVDSILAREISRPSDFTRLFSNVVEDDTTSASFAHTSLRPKQPEYKQIYEIGGYTYLLPFGNLDYFRACPIVADSLTLVIGAEYRQGSSDRELDSVSNIIALHIPGQDTVLTYNYTAYLDSIYNRFADRLFETTDIEVDTLSLTFTLGDYKGKIWFDDLTFYTKSEGPAHPSTRDGVKTSKRGMVLLGKKQ